MVYVGQEILGHLVYLCVYGGKTSKIWRPPHKKYCEYSINSERESATPNEKECSLVYAGLWLRFRSEHEKLIDNMKGCEENFNKIFITSSNAINCHQSMLDHNL